MNEFRNFINKIKYPTIRNYDQLWNALREANFYSDSSRILVRITERVIDNKKLNTGQIYGLLEMIHWYPNSHHPNTQMELEHLLSEKFCKEMYKEMSANCNPDSVGKLYWWTFKLSDEYPSMREQMYISGVEKYCPTTD